MHPHIQRTPQATMPLPGLTSAVRGYWQSVGNAGVACQILGWALCWYTADYEDRSFQGVAVLIALAGICAFVMEFYGRLRHRKTQLPYPKGYSLCRYAGFACAAAAVFLQRYTGQTAAALAALSVGLFLVGTSLMMDKLQRRRLRQQRELEEN